MLAKKMIRDILQHKTQFISIFLMAFIGLFIFAGVGSETVALEADSNNFYEDTNLADGWIYSSYLNDLFLEEVWCLGATTEMERQLVVDSIADFENEPEITLHFVENNTISKFYLLEGKPLDINDSEGVWLDKSFADAKGLKVGDRIKFESQGYEIEKEIKGLGYSPEYVYHPSPYTGNKSEKIGFAYMSYKAFPEESVPYNVLNVKFDGTSETYGKLLEYHLDGYYSSFVPQSEHPSVNHFSQLLVKQKMMTDIFPVVFIVITMLILFTTMTRIIVHQRTQIGILKANGFKNRTINFHYISYGFWLVLSGSILGLILGPLTIPPMFYSSIGDVYKLPSLGPAWDMSFVFVMAFMLLFSIVASFYAISSIANEKPSDAIKPKAPKISTSSFIERLRIWKVMPFNLRWNYRDAKRNKIRGLMTIIGVMGCSALIIGGFGMYDGLNHIKEWEYGQINHYESNLVIDKNASTSQIDQAVDEVNGVTLMESSIELESDALKKSGSLQVLKDSELITPTDNDWNRIELATDEVSISQKMADTLGVGVGDTVKWHIMGTDKWVNVTIDKIHANPVSQGLIMHSEKLDELGLNYTPTSVITSEYVNKTYDGFKVIVTLKDIEDDWNKSMESVWLLIYVLIINACILAIIVLYNLGVLSFTEIEREMATLKVLGFKSNDLRRLLLTQNLIFSVIGFLLGIPLGLYVLGLMWESSGDSLYLIPILTPTNVLLTATIIFSISIIVNLMFSRKIKKLDMVESLKDVE